MHLGCKLNHPQLQLILIAGTLQIRTNEIALDIQSNDGNGHKRRENVDSTPGEGLSSRLVPYNFGCFILDEQSWNDMETKSPIKNIRPCR